MLLCRTRPLRTTAKKPWAAIFLPRFAHTPTATCKNLLCPAPRARPAGFLPVLSEAVLLTEEGVFIHLLSEVYFELNRREKRAKACQKSGPGVWRE